MNSNNEELLLIPQNIFPISGIKDSPKAWKDLPWSEYERKIRQYQLNIFNATKNKDIATARNWQNYLLNCFEAKLLSVRTVTQINSGRRTPGADYFLAINDADRYYLASCLNIDGTTNLIKRIYIPKPGAPDLRPLGIPTIFDRCKQQLVKIAIEPEWEAKFEFMSFGFRPGRKAMDATYRVRAYMLSNGPCWVLDADIRKCFDRISHSYLMYKLNDALPIIRTQINAWLNAGILEPKGFVDQPEAGTPQGGPISPLLCNIALDGLQEYLFKDLITRFGFEKAKNTLYVRYADDLLFLAPTQEMVIFAKSRIEFFLSYINLVLHEEKTRIIQTLDLSNISRPVQYPFDFLGFTFAMRLVSKHSANKIKFDFRPGAESANLRNRIKVTVIPSQKRIQRHKASIKELIGKVQSADVLCKTVNSRIIGWTNYFKYSDGQIYDIPRKLDLWMNAILRKWIRKSTKQRGKVKRFWKQDSSDWIFEYTKEEHVFTIVKYSKYKWNLSKYRTNKMSDNPYIEVIISGNK